MTILCYEAIASISELKKIIAEIVKVVSSATNVPPQINLMTDP